MNPVRSLARALGASPKDLGGATSYGMKEPLLSKILRYLIYASAFVPLIIFSEYISPFHFGKIVIFRSIVEIMAAIYLLLIWKEPSYRPKMTKISWAFLFFALAFSVTTATSVIKYMSFWGSLERMGGLFTFWHYYVYFIILTSIFRTKEEWLNLFKVTIVVGILSAVYGFGQRTDIQFFIGSGGRERIFGTIGNPALFAGYQIFILFLALTLWFYKKDDIHEKVLYGSAVILNTIAVFMTAVRGSIVGVVVGFLVFALLHSLVFKTKSGKNIFLGLISLAIFFIFMAMIFRNSGFVQNSPYFRRVTDFSSDTYTVNTRFWAWQAGLRGWEEGPKTILLGWGPENFNIPFSKHFNPKFFRGPGSETLFDRAHNMFVEILVTMGLLGFLAYINMFISIFKVLWKKMHESREAALFSVGLIPLTIAYMIHNSFIFDTSANFLVFFTILGFISFLSLPGGPADKPKEKAHGKKVNEVLWSFSAVVLAVAAIFVVYRFNVMPSEANYATTRGIVAGWDNDFKGAVDKFKESLSYNVPGKYDYRHRLAQYLLDKGNSGKLSPEMIDALHYAIGEVQKNIDENNIDYLPYLYLSRMYITLGKDDPKSEYNDKALEQSLKALELSPTFVRTYYEIGQAYLNKKDLPKAAEYFQKAAELNPEVGLSLWYWAVVEIEMGNVDQGAKIVDKLIDSGYQLVEQDYAKLVGVYGKRNDYPRIAYIYEQLVGINPANAQYHASLAVAYARIGKVDEAVVQAKEAARLDPKFTAEAQNFVQQIGKQW